MAALKENQMMVESKPTKFIPQRNMTLIRRDPAEDKIGRFHIPDAQKKNPKRGTVVAVGPGERRKKGGGRHPIMVKPGDRVVYGEWSGFEVEVGDEILLVVHEPELLGVLE